MKLSLKKKRKRYSGEKMNEVRLSKRLQKVAEFVPINKKVADIGSDHAYLPCFLALTNQIAYAVAGEVNEGPFQSAKSQVARLSLEGVIHVRKGNGLQVIKPNEVEVVTIAGMGGGLISTILEEAKENLMGVERLVLQPNVTADKVRRWLLKNGWKLVNEEILEEDGKIYEILVADKGDGKAPYVNEENIELSLLLGPYLLKDKNEVFQKKWSLELENWHRILTQFQGAKQTSDVLTKKQELEILIKEVEEVIT